MRVSRRFKVYLLVEVIVHLRGVICVNDCEGATSHAILLMDLLGLVALGDLAVW